MLKAHSYDPKEPSDAADTFEEHEVCMTRNGRMLATELNKDPRKMVPNSKSQLFQINERSQSNLDSPVKGKKQRNNLAQLKSKYAKVASQESQIPSGLSGKYER
mmetsp:Transcript_40131/g.61301  ORF Transcript_40131/g.61301 Transcript_40131/m.61301 type:complete len:104 (+) Transcript_40131:111-422(+)